MNEATKTVASAPPTDDHEARLLAARKAKEDREAARARKAEEEELLEADLEERFERELNGERGRAFFILATTEGPVVVKRGESVIYKRFEAAKDPNEKALLDLVTPCVVYPDKERFTEILGILKGLPLRLANPLLDLYRGKEVDEAGK